MTGAEVTSTCQNIIDTDEFIAAGLVAALEQAWAAIRARHPQVPAAVVIVGAGSPARASQALKWGHFAAGRWQAGTNRLPEVLVSGEGLARSPEQVFTTLLHEAVHGLADTRGVKDTSRQGRWHNKHFATLATELGMTTIKDAKLGYSPCTLTDPTVAVYRPVIDRIADALRAYRHPETIDPTAGRANSNNGFACQCECPRKLRISRACFDEAPVLCALCGAAFLPDHINRDSYESEHPYTVHTGHPTPPVTQPEEGDPSVFYDPTGARYGRPTYPYKAAPAGLATRRQLRQRGLRPGGQDIAAQILWRRGKRVAYLYRIDAALPKRTPTPAQLAALERALTARRTCPTCAQVKPYYIPRRHGECLDCTPAGTR